jgi:peptide/nickel transport system ATP-binding protein
VANIADEAVVMYDGHVMEAGTIEAIFAAPEHPYLISLLRAVPRFGMAAGERLKPVREITPTTGHLLAPREKPAPERSRKAPALLSVQGIVKEFEVRGGRFFGERARVRAVDDVSFEVRRGETLGLVGESGCGKTTLCKMIMRAEDPDAGRIVFDDGGTPVDLSALRGPALVPYRRRYQYVFQDPFSALNPRMTVFDLVSEPLVIHGIGDRAYRVEMVKELMELVGLDPRFLNRYPHSFSGGQRQRISIARALALKPELLVLDEPVSALDVSVQAQILNLMKDLQDTLGLTYLFVSHNLAVVDYVADRIAVMCRGRLVEIAPRDVLFNDPVHPYTRALLSAVPVPDPGRRLDLTALMEGRASDPRSWPAPFTVGEHAHLALMQISREHFVRMSEDQNMVRRAG